MKNVQYSLQLLLPHEFVIMLGRWVRALRHRAELTQPMLAERAGVAVSSLSRLERTGLGSTLFLSKVLFALAESDAVADFVKERIRLAELPRDIEQLAETPKKRQRVRPVKRSDR